MSYAIEVLMDKRNVCINSLELAKKILSDSSPVLSKLISLNKDRIQDIDKALNILQREV